MTISSIETFHYAVPFESGGPQVGFRPSLAARPWTRMEAIFVRVTTADGLTGWGEAFGNMGAAGTMAMLSEVVAPFYVGQDEASLEALTDECRKAFMSFGRSGPTIYSISAMDIALWDLAAQRAGQPLWRHLGAQGGGIDCYASLMRYGGDLEAIRRNTRRAVEAGFTLIKIHETVLEAIQAALAEAGDAARIMLDVNCGYTANEAVAMARALSSDNLFWIEEPLWPAEDFEAIGRVRAAGLPVALGENAATTGEFLSLLDFGTADFIQPSVSKIGGVTEMLRLFEKVPHEAVYPHSFYWGPGYVASAHLSAALRSRPPLETAMIRFEDAPHDQFDPMSRTFELADRPGLGFVPDLMRLEPHLVAKRVFGD